MLLKYKRVSEFITISVYVVFKSLQSAFVYIISSLLSNKSRWLV